MVSLFQTMGVMVALRVPCMDLYRLESKSLLIFNLVILVFCTSHANRIDGNEAKNIILPFQTHLGTLMDLQRISLKNFQYQVAVIKNEMKCLLLILRMN